MHVQPGSKQVRQYIPTTDYFQLMAEQKRRSYIGLSLATWADEAIERRLAELKALEQRGFVYLGEKNWINAYYEERKSKELNSYDAWVRRNFSRFLQLEFTIDENYPTYPVAEEAPTIWKAYMDAKEFLLSFSELAYPAYTDIDDLEVFVAGTKEAPSAAYLCQAFEFLHNFEYALSTQPVNPRDPRPISVTGIDVTNPTDPGLWELNVISEYGSEWDQTFVNGVVWRAG